MELRQLTHFLAVAEERHFTRAAQRVHLTQSSLSSSIRSLERKLGSELFVRSTRQVELTQAGRALTPAARRAVAASEEAKDAVAGVRGLVRGQLTIGAIQLRGLLDIPALLARYHRRHPAVAVRLRHDSVTSLVRRTADGELELAIVDLPLGPQANRVRAHALGTEALRLAVPADDPLATRRRIRLDELTEHAFVEYRADSSVRASIDQACQGAGLQRHVAAEVDTIADLVEMVAHGVGISLLPPVAIRMAGGRVLGLVTEPSIPRDVMLVTPLDHQPSPAAKALLTLMETDSGR
ncbi:MAG: LysR family transcriptional regulator [Solirubrobacteraceae bacterium]